MESYTFASVTKRQSYKMACHGEHGIILYIFIFQTTCVQIIYVLQRQNVKVKLHIYFELQNA
uniref:Uncharacterized protein n=1 Tax=Arion vulgaris TaxID=1028688 RepID=A0A0B6Y9D8_9EUPU